jgi:antitoxin component YwqK of YwqJK toxin-antitoxin module
MNSFPAMVAAVCLLPLTSSYGANYGQEPESLTAEKERLVVENALLSAGIKRIVTDPDALLLEKERLAAEEERLRGEKTATTYPDGMRRAEGYPNEHGKPVGLWTSWYENGQKGADCEYKNGERDGHYTAWHENGHKQREGEYKDGEKEGLWTYWYSNGQMEFKAKFKDGRKEGRYTAWYANGQKEKEGRNNHGWPTGVWTHWYRHGQKEKEGKWGASCKTGVWTYWYANGEKEKEIEYNVHGEEVRRISAMDLWIWLRRLLLIAGAGVLVFGKKALKPMLVVLVWGLILLSAFVWFTQQDAGEIFGSPCRCGLH